MGNIKFKVKERAGDDDHKMYTKLSVEGESIEVRDFLRMYLSDK